MQNTKPDFRFLIRKFVETLPNEVTLESLSTLQTVLCCAFDVTPAVEEAFERTFSELVAKVDSSPSFEYSSSALERLYDAWNSCAELQAPRRTIPTSSNKTRRLTA